MKKASVKKSDDGLRPEYDLSQLKGGVRGKYYRQAAAGTNLMLIEPELAEVFGDAESVNRALRLLVDTAEAVAGPARRRHGALWSTSGRRPDESGRGRHESLRHGAKQLAEFFKVSVSLFI